MSAAYDVVSFQHTQNTRCEAPSFVSTRIWYRTYLLRNSVNSLAGRATRRRRHDACVNDAQPLRAMNPQILVDNTSQLSRHLGGGADGMHDGGDVLPSNPRRQFIVLIHSSPRAGFLRLVLDECRTGHPLAHPPHHLHHDVHVCRVTESAVVDERIGLGIRRVDVDGTMAEAVKVLD
jgi:hypothetical protein